jgi:hypothetical protein
MADEPAEVAGILGDQDAILFDASLEDGVVESPRLPTSSG